MFSRMILPGAIALFAVASSGCDVFSELVVLGADDGVPPVEGSTSIDIPQDYECGDPIESDDGAYTVTSTGDANACTFTFSKEILVLAKEDYASNPALEGATFIQRVDLDVSTFDVVDTATDERPDNLESVDGKAFGTTILTEADLERETPFTIEIEGEPVDALKDQVSAKQDVFMPVDVVVVVALPAPATIDLKFEAQPNVVMGF